MPFVDQFDVAKDHFVFAGPQVVGDGYITAGGFGISHHSHVAFDHQGQVPDVVPFGLDQLAHHVLPFVQRLFALVLVRLQSRFAAARYIVGGVGGGRCGRVLFLCKKRRRKRSAIERMNGKNLLALYWLRMKGQFYIW